MKTRIQITVGALVIAAVALFMTWRLFRRAEALDAAKVTVSHELELLRTRRAQLAERRHAAEAKLAARIAVAESSPPKPKTVRPAKPSWLELIRTDPKVQNLYLEYQRAEVLLAYAPLVQQLQLSADRVQKFVDIVARKHAEDLDLRSALLAEGLTHDDPAVQSIMGQAAQRYELAQQALLGDEGLAKLKAFEHDAFTREMVDGILGHAVLSGVAFSPEQVPQLVGALHAAGGDVTDWQKFDAAAARFLTPQQLEFLQTHETLGPRGAGWRFQGQLNDLITKGDEADHAAAKSESRSQATAQR